ncbi:MAG: outer membrane protein assembly factor BamD [Planctomycetota bacterium]
MPRIRLALLALTLASTALAQTEYRLEADGRWVPVERTNVSADEQTIARARTLIADGKPLLALSILDAWIERQDTNESPLMPEALLRRGDAKVASGDEFEALYDYEDIVKEHVGTPQFPIALEREMEISLRYLNGLRMRWLGMRLEDATPIGEELLLRVQERLPGSQLAEQACIALADFYYRTRDLKMAAETYDVFLQNYPNSEYRQRAMLRKIYANIAQFKGPAYDASPLSESRQLITRFARLYPAEAERAGVNDALSARLDESAGAQMLEVARWYLRRSDPVSARLTLTRLFAKHPQTVAARNAEAIFVEKGWPLPAKPEVKPDAKPEVTTETKPEATTDAPAAAPAPTGGAK